MAKDCVCLLHAILFSNLIVGKDKSEKDKKGALMELNKGAEGVARHARGRRLKPDLWNVFVGIALYSNTFGSQFYFLTELETAVLGCL